MLLVHEMKFTVESHCKSFKTSICLEKGERKHFGVAESPDEKPIKFR